MSKERQSVLVIPDCTKITIVGEKEYKCCNMCQEADDTLCLWHMEIVRPGFSLATRESELEIKPRPITDEEKDTFFHTFEVRGMELPVGEQQYAARLAFGIAIIEGIS